MGTGILLCGLNGSGKSTLGKFLAEKLGFYFIDREDLYFPKTSSRYLYDAPRTEKEAEAIFSAATRKHENFVYAAVRESFPGVDLSIFQHIFLLEVPREIRLRRVKERSFHKFGGRMLPGGDLYEQENGFLNFVKARPEDMVIRWLAEHRLSAVRIDGTRPVEETADYLVSLLKKAKN